MQLLINKRLVPAFVVLLTAFNVVPVGLISFANLDILKASVILIFFITVIKFRFFFEKDIRQSTFFLLAIGLSAVNMIGRGKYMDWTLFYCLNYLNFFLLILLFRSIQDIKDYLVSFFLFSLIASLIHALFYAFPSLLAGPLTDIRMGSVHMDSSKTRIFIPGMGLIALAFIYLVTKLLYYKTLRIYEFLLIFLFGTSILIFASVRTYLLGVLVAIFLLLVMRRLSFRKMIYLIGGTGVSMLILSLISGNLYTFLVERLDVFVKISDFRLLDVIQLNVDYDNEQTFGTVYFRILEVIYVIQNYSGDWRSILFGNLGTLYDFLGVEQETAPHISVFGIYYLFGLVGLGAFVGYFLFYTRLIIGNLRRYRNKELEFVSIILAVFWFTLFVISFFGGIFYSEMILMVTFTAAASVFLKRKYVYG